MKKLVLLFGIVLLAQPVFATPGYDPAKDTGPELYDDSAYQAYCTKLEEDFDKKYYDAKTGKLYAPIGAYTREVTLPKGRALGIYRVGSRDYFDEQERLKKNKN